MKKTTLFFMVIFMFLFVSCKEQMNNLIDKSLEEARKELPTDIGDGMTMTSIDLEGDYIVYAIECDEELIDIDRLISNQSDVKKSMVESLSDNSDKDSALFLRLCKQTQKGLAWKYVGKDSGKECLIEIPYDEIK